MKNEPKPSEAEPKSTTPPGAKKPADPAGPRKPPYVFKIVPADPKNAFDFEDVADK